MMTYAFTKIFHRFELLPLSPKICFDDFERLEIARRKRKFWNRVVNPLSRRIARASYPMDVVVTTKVLARDNYPITVRIFKPKTLTSRELPVILLLHGGGWVFGSADAYELFSRRLSTDCECIVVVPEYRLAPEHKFPCALHDCEDVLKWLWDNPIDLQRLMASAERRGLIVCGDGAGGNLAASLCVLAKRLKIRIKLQVLLYPMVAYEGHTLWKEETIPSFSSSMIENSLGPILTLRGNLFCWSSYANIYDIGNPYLSPILFSSADLSHIAPSYVVTCGKDVLRDEDFAYVEKLRKAGVQVQHNHYNDVAHGFMTFLLFEQKDSSPFLAMCSSIFETLSQVDIK